MLGEHIVPQSEVIRAILLEDSPCCGVHTWDGAVGAGDNRRVAVRRAEEHALLLLGEGRRLDGGGLLRVLGHGGRLGNGRVG